MGSVMTERPWWSWVATGTLGAVVVGAVIHVPAAPANASPLTEVGEAPCIHQVTDPTSVAIAMITDEVTNDPTHCVVTITEDTGWAVPTNVSELWVVAVGGGGGGSSFGGGGGGDVYENVALDVSSLFGPEPEQTTTIDVVIGGGGVGQAGSVTRFGNIDAQGGDPGAPGGAGGDSGGGRLGGSVVTGDGSVIAGGGGGGAGSDGTSGLLTTGEPEVAPTSENIEILGEEGDSGESDPGSEEGGEETPPSDGGEIVEEGGTQEPDPGIVEGDEPEEGSDGGGIQLFSESLEEGQEPEGQGDPAPTPELRAGNGGNGVSSDITGTTVWFGGGGGGALDTDGGVFTTGGGQNGDGGGTESRGGGGQANSAGGDGVVIIRYLIPEKALQTLTWDIALSVELGEQTLALDPATTTGDGVITYQVLDGSTSDCAITVTEADDGNGGILTQISLAFTTAGSCLVRTSAAESAAFQAATLDKTITITTAPPVIQAATPNQGPADGGTRVTITGSNLTGVTSVTFGGREGTDLEVVSDTELRVTTPTRAVGDFVTSNALIQLASLGATSTDDVTFAFQGGTFMLDNGVIRFGGSGGNNGSADDVTTNSIAPGGVPNQPYYRAANGSWFKLTFSNAPLSMTVATAEGSSNNWTGSRVPDGGNFDNGRLGLVRLDNMVVTVDNWTTRREAGGINVGYGKLTVSGTADINGRLFGIQHQMDLGANASFVRINTRLINLADGTVPGVHMWVGTRDDYVGTSDRPTKTRGTLAAAGGFAAIANSSATSNAIQITSGAEGVLFYSTTPGVNSVHQSCCNFSNSYNLDPNSSSVTTTGDGSYAMYLPVGSLDKDQARDITWFYAAGSIQELGNVAQAVAQAALPPRPTVVRGDGEATIVWEEPDPGPGNTIIGYNYRYSTDGGVTWVEGPGDLPTVPLTTTVTNLDNSLNYEFQIRAIIQEGADTENPIVGQWSPTTQSAILGAPQRPTLSNVAGGDRQVTLSFVPPDSLVDDITGYEYSTDGGETWQSFVAVGNPAVFSVSGLDNGEEYSVGIRAVNDIGESEASATIRVRTLPVLTTTEFGTLTRDSAVNLGLQAGQGTLTWQVVSGSLPLGVSLNPTTGRLSGTPTTAGPYDVTIGVANETGQATRQFVGVVVPYWPDNAIQFGGPATRALQTVIATDDILGLDTSGGAEATVTGLPAGMQASITNTGQAGVLPTVTLAGTPTTPGLYPVQVTITAGGRSVTQEVTLVVTAAPSPPQQPTPRPRVAPAAVVDIAPPAPPLLQVPAAPSRNAFIPVPPVVSGPVLDNGRPPTPSNGQVTIRRGEGSEGAQARVVGSSGVEVTAGSLSLGIRVTSGTGEVRALDNGAPEILVEKGGEAQIQGSGFLPFSTAQVFLPLGGANAIELARVQVDERGALNGQARFLAGPGQAPIPVGTQVLQIVTVDSDGNQVSVDMTVTIAQPPPTPELNRETGDIPTLTPGQSFATEAGLPVTIRVDVDPAGGAMISGGDWSMNISVDGAASQQTTTSDGQQVIEIVRNSIAGVSGSGFMPQTRVDVWLFSTPTLVGTVVTDDEGAFEGFVSVDSRTVPAGTHTLQMQGIGTDGYVRAANLGVVVTDALTGEPSTLWAWWWWALGGGLLGFLVWFLFGRRADSDDDEDLDSYDPNKRVYSWSVTENSPKRGSYKADLIGVSLIRHS